MAQLDPVAQRSLSFLFPRCQARLDGADLVVTVPAPQVSGRAASGAALRWDKPAHLDAPVLVECEPGAHRRADQSEYPVAPAYARSVEFRFRGAVWYGKVPLPDGWALCVQGAVRSLHGLPPAWAGADAILVETSFTESRAPQSHALRINADGGGPVNGPHLPYP
jgi:hypothetical protein